jgi:peptide/nickel transport system permease protein
MKTYIFKRLLTMIPMLLGVTFLVFLLMSLSPGDFLTPIKAQRDISAEYIRQLEAEFGLNRPWYVQYFLWLKNLLHLDFGYSWTYKIPVVQLLAQRAPCTLLLSITSLIFSWAVAIPLGVLAAVYKGSIFDKISAFLAYTTLSVPGFFLALVAVYFAARTGWFPTGGLTSIDHDYLSFPERILDYAHHLFLPTLILGIGGIAGLMRIMRTSTLDVIHADYVMTARAKGLGERAILFRHVLRNAINPLVTTLGFAFSGLLSGALLVENVMNYPGLGQLVYQAFLRKDQFVVLGAVVLGSVMLIVGNLLADLLLAWTDPRIRYDK